MVPIGPSPRHYELEDAGSQKNVGSSIHYPSIESDFAENLRQDILRYVTGGVWLARKKNRKITKYRKYSFFNIGTLLFGIVFIYMIICIIMYATEKHITVYEVMRGSLSGNYRFHALALRTEAVVNTTHSGSVRYYVREGSRASAGSTVCSVNETGAVGPVAYEEFVLDASDESRLQNTLSSFTINFSPSAFQSAYDLKSNVETTVAEVMQSATGLPISVRNGCEATASGFVVYHTDGMESLTEPQLSQSLFDESSYHVNSLRGNNKVSAGSPVFKLITGEDWALYFPLDDQLGIRLASAESITFRFLKDNVTYTAPFSIVRNGSEAFGKISMNHSLVRYVTDRFLEIELVMNQNVGLKIPVTSITQREFYRIPEEYAIVNADTSSEITLLVEEFAADGSSKTEYRTANVYRHNKIDKYYLVDKQLLQEGCYLLKENSATRMQVQEKDTEIVSGVYNINKGYAVFRDITVLDENEEYCIVSSNTFYGLAVHDYIVQYADEVTEEEIVY